MPLIEAVAALVNAFLKCPAGCRPVLRHHGRWL